MLYLFTCYMQQIQKQLRFLIVTLVPQKQEREVTVKDLEETYSLVQTLGNSIVVDMLQQRADEPDNRTFIGMGKVQEVAQRVKDDKIDVVVINNIVKSGQLFNIKKKLQKTSPGIEIWDRIDLILAIFDSHAHTAEAKLQIELAKMRHMGPRIYGMGMVLSRQGGGIGGRGIGETNTELMKRHWRDAIKEVQEKLKKLSGEREKQIQRRRDLGLQTVSIVGYTNAGKTSLFNRLSRKHKLAENALFATLDSAVGKMYLPDLGKEILLSDTIGFIRNLPTDLIDAFTSTLLESVHADILLHVIDVSDSDMQNKIAVVENILKKIGVNTEKKIYVFTKIDAIVETLHATSLQEQYASFSPQFISVKTGEGIEALVKEIEKMLA